MEKSFTPVKYFILDDFIEDMLNIKAFFEGKKTYILGTLGVIYGATGFWTGHLGSKEASEIIWASLVTMTMRAGISGVGR